MSMTLDVSLFQQQNLEFRFETIFKKIDLSINLLQFSWRNHHFRKLEHFVYENDTFITQFSEENRRLHH
jgi:hypothetical protein